MAASNGKSGVLNELLGQVCDGVVVAISFIGFEHGELRRVRAVSTFIAEVAVDFEHALDATDECTLQVKLRCNTQEELHVEGVGVGHEGACRRTTVHDLQHRSLNLNEVKLREGVAQRGHGLRTSKNVLPSLLANNEVEIAGAHTGFFVELVVHVGKRKHSLSCHLPFLHHDGKLTATARNHFTRNVQVVTEVNQVFPQFEVLFAHLGQRDHGLDAGTIT